MVRGILIFVAIAISMGGTGAAISEGDVIVAFGDSTTAVRSTVPKVYPELLHDQLPGLLGRNVTVFNAGVGGETTTKALARINSDVRSHNPDCVIVQFGINDSWVNSQVQGDPPRVSINTYTANLDYIVNTLKDDGARVILMTTNQLNAKLPAPNVPQWQGDLLGSYNQVVRTIAAARHVELLDVWQMYTDYDAAHPGNNIPDLLVDGLMHPNQAGHTLVADGLTAMIVPEPGTLALVITAGLGLLVYAWRQRQLW